MRYKTRSTIAHLDILLLTCNFLDDTKRCIESLYSGDPDFALTIVDNGSTDGTVKWLRMMSEKHNNITLDLQKENLGVVKGRNHAYAISRDISPSTDYIMFIDNDQTLWGGWEVYLKYMEMGFDIVGSEAWQMDGRRMMPTRKCKMKTDVYNYVGCGGMMIKHHVIQDIGLFDERFSPMYFEDPDFCFRAYKAGYRIMWNRYGCEHHHSGNLLSKDDEIDRSAAFHKSHIKFVEKHAGTFPPELRIPPKSLMDKMAAGV